MSTVNDNPITHVRSLASKAFARIGTSNGTAPLKSKSNTYGSAHEFFIASLLKTQATKRYDQAKKVMLLENGFDPDKLDVGMSTEVSSNEHLTIAAKKATPRKMLNQTKLINKLSRSMGAKEAADLIAECTDEAKGAVSYEVIL